MCSAKQKQGLNKVFHTAFKVVFQIESMDRNRAGGGQTGAPSVDLGKPSNARNQNAKGGCCK